MSASEISKAKRIFFVSVQSGDRGAVYKYLLSNGDPNATDSNGRNGLHMAALCGHHDVFQTLLSAGADPEQSDKQGITPLMCASQRGNEATVDSLLEKQVDVSKKEKGNKTAVFYALYNRHLRIAEKLEQRNTSIRALGEEHVASIFMKATTENWVDVAQFLKEQGCNMTHSSQQRVASEAGLRGHIEVLKCFNVRFDEKTSDGRSPLRGAVQNGFVEAVKYMLDSGCDVRCNEEITRVAILNGHLDVLKLLQERGAPLFKRDEDGDTPVQLAIIFGSFDLFKYLVEQNGSLEASKRLGPLSHIAVRGQKIEILKYLTESTDFIDEADERTGETLLLEASQRGPIELVELLLDKGCDPSHRNYRGVTPALRSASCKLEEILMLLAERGAELNSPNLNTGETAILAAARVNSFAMVKFLADFGCSLNARDLNGNTLAFYAAQANNNALLKHLKLKNVPLDVADIFDTTPLMIAVKKGALDAVKFLTSQNCCDINHQDILGSTPMHHAVVLGDAEIVRHLKGAGADLTAVDRDGNTPLLICLKEKKPLDVVKLLLGRDADLQATNNKLQSVLHLACMQQENDAALLLFELASASDAQDCNGFTPFMVCAAQGSESMAIVSNAIGADVNRRNYLGENAVHLAAKSGNMKMVQYYSMFGCHTDQEDKLGITPLMIACSKNNAPMVEFLIRKGADVNSVTYDGRTPSHFACASGSLEVLKQLHENKAELDRPDLSGVTPILLAAEKQNECFLKFLCNQNCDLKRTDKALRTALHFAVQGGNKSVIGFLVDQSLDPNALDESGTSPVLLSVKLKSTSILKLLESKGRTLIEIFDRKCWSAAHFACQTGNLELLKEGAKQLSLSSLTAERQNCLTIACMNAQEDVLKFLLQRKPNINFKNSNGENALHIAARQSHLSLIPLLISAGIRVRETDNDGNNVLHILGNKISSSHPDRVKRENAGKKEQIERAKIALSQRPDEDRIQIMKLIESQGIKKNLPDGCLSKKDLMEQMTRVIEAGVDVNHVNKAGKTALHFACVCGSLKVINLLLSSSADPNLQDSEGETPIFTAIRNRKFGAAQLLLRKGAKVNVESKAQLTPLALAMVLNEGRIMQLLQQQDGQFNADAVLKFVTLHDIFRRRNLEHLECLISMGFDCGRLHNGKSVLHHIVAMGSIRLLKDFVNAHKKLAREIVDLEDADKDSALHLAIMKQRPDIAEEIVKLGCRVNLMNKKGHTVLHVAAICNQLAIVKWVCENCPKICETEPASQAETQSPLHLAAIKGNLEVFKFLQRKGFSAASKCKGGKNCAHYAAIFGNLHILQHIEDEIYKKEKSSEIRAEEPEVDELETDSKETEKLFVEKNREGFSPLQCAVLNGHQNIASFLYKFDQSLPECIAHQALCLGNQHMLDWAVNRGAAKQAVDPKTGESSLTFAALSGNYHLVSLFSGPDQDLNAVDRHGNTAAQAAAARNHRHILRHLWEKKANMDIPDREGDTPIFDCAINGHLEALKMLVEFGCNLRHRNLRQRSIVHVACIGAHQTGHLNIVKFAQEQQLQLDDVDDQGNTGLMYACRQGFKDIVNFLLKEGKCDPNIKNRQDSTAAHLAALAGRADILEALLHSKARLDAEDGSEATPLMIAVSRDYFECVTLLARNAGLGQGGSRQRLECLAAWASPEVRRQLEALGAAVTAAEGEK